MEQWYFFEIGGQDEWMELKVDGMQELKEVMDQEAGYEWRTEEAYLWDRVPTRRGDCSWFRFLLGRICCVLTLRVRWSFWICVCLGGGAEVHF